LAFSPHIWQTTDDTAVYGPRTILATVGRVPLSIHFGAGRDDSRRFSSENLTTDFLARRNRSRTQAPDFYHRWTQMDADERTQATDRICVNLCASLVPHEVFSATSAASCKIRIEILTTNER
jgi:hypothetical protein